MQKEQEINTLSRNTSIEHYEIREVLYFDGVSVTYKAWDTKRIRLVVIKEYFPSDLVTRTQNASNVSIFEGKTEEFGEGLKRFIDQAKNLALLDHSNIIKVHAYCNLNNTAYQCLPFEHGQSLSQLLAQQDETLSEEELKPIFEAILTGLEYIHEHNVHHNNVLLDNIFIRNKGVPLLINFDPTEKAPINLDCSADVSALGQAMYRCVTGKESIATQSRLNTLDEELDQPLTPALEIGLECYSTELLNFIDWIITPESHDPPLNASLVLSKLKTGLSEFHSDTFPLDIDTDKLQTAPSTTNEDNALETIGLVSTTIESEPESELESDPFLEQEDEVTVDIAPKTHSLAIAESSSTKPKKWLFITGLGIILLCVIALSQKQTLQELFTSPEFSADIKPDQTSPLSSLNDKTNASNEISQKSENRVKEGLANSDKQGIQTLTIQELIQLKKPKKIVEYSIEKELTKSKQQSIDQGKAISLSKPEQIKVLLAKAANDTKRQRLSTPKGNNALEKYKKALQLDPENEIAQNGLDTIIEKYLQLAEKASKRNHYIKAQDFLDNAKAIHPQNPAVVEAEHTLKTNIANYKQQTENIIQQKVKKELAKSDKQRIQPPNIKELIQLKEPKKIVAKLIKKELTNSNQHSVDQEKVISLSKQKQIKVLLAKAANNINRLSLSTPKGNNALEKYKKALQLDPENKLAQNGLDTIIEKYLQLAEKASKRNHYIKAHHYLDSAKAIQPQNLAVVEAEIKLKSTIAINKQKQSFKKEQPLAMSHRKTPSKIDMVWINPDCFQMGDNEIYSAEHKVCLTKGFYLGKYEVTQSQWQDVMGKNPSVYTGSNKPVHNISWNNVQIFIHKLNELTGKNYRLPTEAEWEYACRSGGKLMKFCGSNNANRVAWYKENSENTINPVGQKQPNGLGLYDMSGNVWEWTQDFYKVDYYNNSPINNPKGPIEGTGRVVRGGSWFSGKSVLRSAYRVWYAPGIRVSYLGFRLAK